MPSFRIKFNQAIVFLAACLLTCWAILFWASISSFGLGLDEGYYLISASDPYKIAYNVTQSGFVWHPLYLLLGGSVALFRFCGTVVLEGCAIVFGLALARFLRPRLQNRSEFFCIVLAVGTTVWWQLGWWDGIAPSYSMLNLCGLLVFFSGLIEAVTGSRIVIKQGLSRTVMPAIMGGFGLMLIACAKPPTAALAVISGLVWLVCLPIRNRVLLIVGTAVIAMGLFSIAAICISGDLGSFFRNTLIATRLSETIYNSRDLAHSAFNVVIMAAAPDRGSKILMISAFIAAAFLLTYVWTGLLFRPAHSGKTRKTALISAGAAIFLVWMAWSRAIFEIPNRSSLHALEVVFPMIFFCLAVRIGMAQRGVFRDERAIFIIAALLMTVPFSAAVGTSGPIMERVHGVTIFWCAAVLCIATCAPRPERSAVLAGSAVLCGAVTLGLLAGFAMKPSINGLPMWRQNELITLGPKRSTLLVDAGTREYLNSLMTEAYAHGFKAADPLFNFSAQSGPGTAFALGASSPGAGFMGYTLPRSAPFLETVPREEIRRAWILVDDDDAGVVSRLPWQLYGLNFPQSYEAIFRMKVRPSAMATTLWRPKPGS